MGRDQGRRDAQGRVVAGQSAVPEPGHALRPHPQSAGAEDPVAVQITATFASLSVCDNVQMALYSHAGRLRSLLSRFGAAFKAEADSLLGQVGMLEQAERICGVLAYGDLKRVELAMALANQPRLLLMDEPTAGMAPKERIELMALVARLARVRNIAVLFTEHDMDVVFGQADRIIVLDRGQLIAGGTPQEVRANPNVRAVYLGSVH